MLVADALGRRLTHRAPFTGRAEAFVFSAALGLGLLGQLLFLLGLAQLLYPGAVVLLAAAALLPRLRVRHHFHVPAGRQLRHALRLPVILAVIVVPFPFLLALYPPTEFDATLYHLPAAKAFAAGHTLLFVETIRFPVFPQLSEVLFAGMMLTVDDVAAQLVHLLQTLLAALALYALGCRLFARRVGVWAAALWLGNPVVLWLGAAAYVDSALSLYGLLAVGAWEIWRRDGERTWLVFSALCAGFAAATKYPGLLFVVALLTLTAWRAPSGRRRFSVLLYLLLVLLVAGPWYGRILYHTGNPLFPFLSSLFGDSAWNMPFDRSLESEGELAWAKVAARFELERLPLLPWRAAFDRGAFHHQAPLSPFYLLLLPVLALFSWSGATLRRLLLLALGYVVVWTALPDHLHLLLPAVALLSLASAAALDRALERAPPIDRRAARWPVILLVAGLLASQGYLYAGYKLWERGPLPTDPASREAYLERQLPLYPALRHLNREHGADYTVYGLLAENLNYHADGRFLGDWFGPYSYHPMLALLEDPPQLARHLRSLGAGFLLVSRRPGVPQLLPAVEPERHFETLLDEEAFVLYAVR